MFLNAFLIGWIQRGAEGCCAYFGSETCRSSWIHRQIENDYWNHCRFLFKIQEKCKHICGGCMPLGADKWSKVLKCALVQHAANEVKSDSMGLQHLWKSQESTVWTTVSKELWSQGAWAQLVETTAKCVLWALHYGTMSKWHKCL